MSRLNVVVLTGAGISAESGLKTFRDSDGLWNGYHIHEVATPEAWAQNPQLVLEFYNTRRRELKKAQPNAAHLGLVRLEEYHHVDIVTQNVDDLHERAGSNHVIHLHGELLKSRSVNNPDITYPCTGDIRIGDTDGEGHQLRPHIVWFGELVPMLEDAVRIIEKSQILVVIGTSLQVYPAAGLVQYAPYDAEIIYIDPLPSHEFLLSRFRKKEILSMKATEGMKKVFGRLTAG